MTRLGFCKNLCDKVGIRHTQARIGRTEMVKALIVAGADVNTKFQNNWSALWYAAEAGHTEIVEILKQAGARH